MRPMPYKIDDFFDTDKCDRCGICFSGCPEMHLSEAAAREEIRMAIKGRPRYALKQCNACRACDALCPKDCKPFGLLSVLRDYIYEGKGAGRLLAVLSPGASPSIFSATKARLPERELAVLGEWATAPEGKEEVFLPGILSLMFPYLWDSQLLRDLPVFAGEKLDPGALYRSTGCLMPSEEAFSATLKVLKGLGIKRVIAETETYDLLKGNPYKKKFDFEVIHILKWLLEKLRSGDIQVTAPLNRGLVLHDSYVARERPELMEMSRELIEVLGGRLIEPERTGEEGLGCGFGIMSRSMSLADMIAQGLETFKELENTGAEGIATYCDSCLWILNMVRNLTGLRLPVYHTFELARMATGESPLQEQHEKRAWIALGALGDGILSNRRLSENVWVDDFPPMEGPGYAGPAQPFPSRTASSLLGRKPVRDMISTAGPLLARALEFRSAARKGLFKVRVRAGSTARAALASTLGQLAKRAIPAPADLIFWAGTRQHNKVFGNVKKALIKLLPLHIIVRITGRPLIFMPCAPVFMKMLGRNYEETMHDSQLQMDIVDKIMENLKIDILLGIADGTIELEALGAEIGYPDVGVPYVLTHPGSTLEELESLKLPDPSKDARMPIFIEANRLMCEKYKTMTVVLAGGPFSMACLIAGADNLCTSMITNPEYARKVMDFSCQVSKVYIEALAKTGVDMVVIGDPSCSILSRKHFWEFVGKPLQKLIAESPVPVLLHVCGTTSHLIELMVRTGPPALSLDEVDMPAIVPRVPKEVLIAGNIHTVKVLAQGTVEDVRREVADLCEGMRDIPTFLCAPGCEVPTESTLENLRAMIDESQKQAKKRD